MCSLISTGYSMDKNKALTDSTKTDRKTKTVIISIGESDNKQDKTDSVKRPSSRFSMQLTFARVDLGLSTYIDNGSFTLSPENGKLEHERWKTHNFGFELLQTGYRFNSYFKIYLAAGLDWNHIRLKQNVSIVPDQPVLTIKDEDIDFKKNRLSSTYLRIPLSFQIRGKDDQRGNKVYFVAGPEVGFLLNGKTKQVSKELGKVKYKDDFNFNPFRYGAFVRFGYDNIGLYAKYYANDVFADNQGPKDFRNFNFGLMVGF